MKYIYNDFLYFIFKKIYFVINVNNCNTIKRNNNKNKLLFIIININILYANILFFIYFPKIKILLIQKKYNKY